MFATLLGAYFAAALLGLAVSAAAPTQEWAVAALPLLILPQLLLLAEATGQPARDGHFHSAAYLPGLSGDQNGLRHPLLTEFASLLTFTRPEAALLRAPAKSPEAVYVLPVNLTHLLVLTVASGAAVWVVLTRREVRWILDHGTARNT